MLPLLIQIIFNFILNMILHIFYLYHKEELESHMILIVLAEVLHNCTNISLRRYLMPKISGLIQY